MQVDLTLAEKARNVDKPEIWCLEVSREKVTVCMEKPFLQLTEINYACINFINTSQIWIFG